MEKKINLFKTIFKIFGVVIAFALIEISTYFFLVNFRRPDLGGAIAQLGLGGVFFGIVILLAVLRSRQEKNTPPGKALRKIHFLYIIFSSIYIILTNVVIWRSINLGYCDDLKSFLFSPYPNHSFGACYKTITIYYPEIILLIILVLMGFGFLQVWRIYRKLNRIDLSTINTRIAVNNSALFCFYAVLTLIFAVLICVLVFSF